MKQSTSREISVIISRTTNSVVLRILDFVEGIVVKLRSDMVEEKVISVLALPGFILSRGTIIW